MNENKRVYKPNSSTYFIDFLKYFLFKISVENNKFKSTYTLYFKLRQKSSKISSSCLVLKIPKPFRASRR